MPVRLRLPACDSTYTSPVFGQNRSISPVCFAQLNDAFLGYRLKPGDVLARDFGPDSSRHLDCGATQSIGPASALDLANVRGYFTSIYAPAPGELNVEAGAYAGNAGTVFVKATRKRHARPVTKPIHLTVKHPGAVHVRFHPTKLGKRLFARRHKLKLRVKITLKPSHHAAITRPRTVPPPRPPKPPSARQRRRAIRKLCRHKYPHQARRCNRL